ncbi:tRNA pseudouridine(38/39) synthase isoform X2 [Diachasma alloeum]|uniref:tRNA pseudouridine(38/39) synthase isoform X2 n=1 Tax=Diachasma alloeum TaxID=454923 RepID=UPI0007380F8A|nr:tRNA pseudouridine(38/39) synthase isoform X2 [Diachasma alloeum]
MMEELSVKRNKHHKNQSSREELELLDKKDLIDRILQLEAHTFQLKNIIKKSDSTNGKSVSKKSGKPFDFTQNICKMDVANGVVTFARTILEARIVCHDDEKSDRSGYNMYHLFIKSQAFLWHQIRCIMGILLLVGQGKEKPEIFLNLFDIEACPRKPQYSLAHEVPLNLFHCDYDDVEWYYDDEELVLVIKTLQEDWTFNSVKAAMIRSMLQDLESHVISQEDLDFQSEGLIQGVQSKIYQPLMKRVTCESLENRIKHFEKKRKIAVGNSEQT